MIVVDSSVWIDYFNGVATEQTEALDTLLSRELVVIGDLILVEVLQGFRYDKDFNRAKDLLDSLMVEGMLGKQLAIQSAHNYRKLRRKGATIRKTVDVIIGTFCIENQLPLLHCDRDFDPMVKHLKLMTVI